MVSICVEMTSGRELSIEEKRREGEKARMQPSLPLPLAVTVTGRLPLSPVSLLYLKSDRDEECGIETRLIDTRV